MTDPTDREPIAPPAHDAAAAWLARRQRSRDPATERAFAAWLDKDPAHRSAYEEAERNWRDTLLLAQSGVGRERTLEKAPFLLRHRTQVAAASLCALAVIGIVTIGLVPSGGPVSVVGEARAATYETMIGEIRTVPLPDGSKLTLDTQSRVDVAMTAASRRLRLVRGRARFTVASAPGRPFVVTAGSSEVVATGTTFDVSMTPSGTKVVSILGVVEVRSGSPDRTAEPRQLHAGQQLDVSPAQVISAPAFASQAEARWVSGMVTLQATPLRDAVAAINRYNRTKIRLADPAFANRTVTGAFRATDPEGFSSAVAAMFHRRVLHQGGAIVLAPTEE